MNTTRGFIKDQKDPILLDSIRQQRQVVLTRQSHGGWKLVKAGFLFGSPESEELAVRLLIEADGSSPEAPARAAKLGATFRMGHKKCMFSTEVREVRKSGAHTDLVVQWPDQLQQLQRRAFERATPPAGTVVAVRFWRDSDDPQGQSRAIRHGQLEDVSCGGIRIRVPDANGIEMGSNYKCVFTPRQGKPALVLDTILRHRESVESGRSSLGFQFVGLETSPERLRTLDRLARLVRHYQRAKSRPVRADAFGG